MNYKFLVKASEKWRVENLLRSFLEKFN
jgi:hypothetical protein